VKPGHTSLVSFLGGMSVYFGALVGFLVLEQTLNIIWLVPGALLLVGGFLLGLGLCRDLRSSKKRAEHTPIAKRTLPETHDSSYALSLATRSSRLPRPR
jgi:UDP-N-acetylmuramyl pentapeptide phosphotransferase/UDP-N-acetylglucosamine-1-phosphate transferase